MQRLNIKKRKPAIVMENKHTTAEHPIGTSEDWLAARLKLLEAEKELTHLSDEVARKRQDLPWVKIDTEYMFETEKGMKSLADLFQERSQLLIYHFMFGPDYEAGCPHCSAIADGFNGIWTHLANHDVMLWAVSRAPFAKLQAFKERMGWTFPWASSSGSTFNYDFHVSFSEEQQSTGDIEYNFNKGHVSARDSNIEKTEKAPEMGIKIAATVGVDWATYTRDAPGMSSVVLRDGGVYHTYSSYARGLDGLWNLYQWLDRAPLGRNEKGPWMKRHDEYENVSQNKGQTDSCCD
jgi:predicted dithiol-disulfide oxidoreductase (DUF899 family)